MERDQGFLYRTVGWDQKYLYDCGKCDQYVPQHGMEYNKDRGKYGLDGDINAVYDDLDNDKNIFTTVVTAISTFLTTAWTAISNTVTTVWNAISNFFTTIWNGIRNVVTSVVNGISMFLTTAWNTIKNTISTVVNAIKTAVSNGFNAMLNGIKSVVGKIASTIKDGFNAAVDFIKGLISSAFNWGKDLIMGIVDGIWSCISAVGDAVGAVADTIASFLHFSVPDEGPLTEYEKWMPDFLKGLAKGIKDSKGMVTDAMKDLSADMVVSPQVNGMQMSIAGAGGGAVSNADLSRLAGAIREAVSGINAQGQSGDIVIPVYLGGTLLDEVIIDAQTRANLRSGGR